MKKKILISVSCLLLLCSCQESFEKRVQRTWQEYTEKNCPQALSETVILDSCVFDVDNHVLQFYHRFANAMDNDSIDQKSNAMRQLLLEALRNDTNLRPVKEAGYSFKYVYYSTKHAGKLLYETTFTKEDYQ
jgi:hypothetical protein